MFESNTEKVILKNMMDTISEEVDKREGSIIYNALAPAAQEMARMYSDMDRFLTYTFASSDMPEEFLDLRVSEEGLKREEATYCIKKGYFYDSENNLIDIPLQSRFSINKAKFIAVEKISTGIYRMKAEETGSSSNFLQGMLLPIEYVENLAIANIGETSIPGEETESNESLFKRYIEHLNEKPFAGNIADYKIKTREIDGVGDLKVLPVWNDGGTVKIIFLNSDFETPTEELINEIQTELDPTQNAGEGIGIAPIGHIVTVEGVKTVNIIIQTTVLLKPGITAGQVKEKAEEVIKEYLLELRKNWADENNTIVRINQIEAKLLTIDGIADLFNTKINSNEANLQLQYNEIPAFEEVILDEQEVN